ncbi:alpha/beta-hydrolase [Epithele typhae]|uniref:alpha/beta-hydrolase n=1 Tax=Epithele typhae TaxID=378194 RepID=UPI002008770A|nr:alpha/beta-hydrolase [Epithele typhae]KAH9946254.1 alpha/beta-hydrolase [Epithele typhae]
MTGETTPSGSSTDWQPPPTIFDPTTCTRKGLCPVTHIRHQDANPLESHSLYYEIHGSGLEKIVFIMGLNASASGWVSQVDYFGRKPECSVLVFDNRGVGNSGSPRGPYTTEGMAQDVVTLLDFVGWTEKRQIHVIGISLGGMIAQELAEKILERTASLTLVVTKPGRRRLIELPSYVGTRNLLRSMMVSNPEDRIPLVLETLFPQEWLDSKDPSDPEGRTNRELQTIAYRERIAVTPPQTLVGSLSQMAAAMTHHVSPERLRRISSAIPKVAIVTGDTDTLIDPRNSQLLKQDMPEAELIIREGAGHGVPMQYKEWFNEVLERTLKEGRERAN